MDPTGPAAALGPKPLVSVVIPAFNHERYIERCLTSILEDGYPNKELVVIDDGSSDGTAARAEAWLGSHQQVLPARLVGRSNRGLTRTLNELLDLAVGEFVVPIASDDYLLPGGIEARVDLLLRDPSLNAVFGDCVVVDSEGDMLFGSALFGYRHANRKRLLSRLNEELITNWAAVGPSMLYRREPIRRIGGYNEQLAFEDWDFYLRLAARGWLKYLDRPVAAYRLHGTNTHRDAAARRRHGDEFRRVALASTQLFDAKGRVLLRLEALTYAPVFTGLEPGRLSHLPGRLLRKAVKELAKSVAGAGKPCRGSATP